MKTAVVLYAPSCSRHMFEKVFGGRSSYDCALAWAGSVPGKKEIFVLASSENGGQCRSDAAAAGITVTVVEKHVWTLTELLEGLCDAAEKAGADAAVYAYADCPFLNRALTEETVSTHEKYAAEYTFADGYPYGFAPEVIDKGTARILAELSRTTQEKLGGAEAGRAGIMTLLKTDINSFEIETVLAPKDWRMYRFDFSCGAKPGLASCRALYDDDASAVSPGADAEKLSERAASLVSVLKTVPGFYNVQIDARCGGTCTYCPYPASFEKKYGYAPCSGDSPCMTAGQFKDLAAQMASLSETAAVGLSAWGEPLLHPDFISFVDAAAGNGLAVLVETDGLHVTEDMCRAAKDASDGKMIWIVSLDAVTDGTYGKMRGGEGTIGKASASIPLLQKYFPGNVYPQMVRTKENECELEKFYRYWKNGGSPSAGQLIIQKYDSFAGLLPDIKPADLSPVGRNPCWHIRRDMTILADGSVPVCREYMFEHIIGNVFSEDLETVWNKMTPYVSKDMKGDYDEKCRKCDEYYTFNF